jgi:hypothetical protein
VTLIGLGVVLCGIYMRFKGEIRIAKIGLETSASIWKYASARKREKRELHHKFEMYDEMVVGNLYEAVFSYYDGNDRDSGILESRGGGAGGVVWGLEEIIISWGNL